MSSKKKSAAKKATAKKTPAPAATAPAAAGKTERTFKPGDTVNFHHALSPWSADEYAQLKEEAQARKQTLPERGSFALRPATVAEGPNPKGQFLLRMLDDASELVTSSGVKAGQFSA